jgi:hypothetical protein
MVRLFQNFGFETASLNLVEKPGLCRFFLKKHIFAALGRENVKSVRKVTGFVDRH